MHRRWYPCGRRATLCKVALNQYIIPSLVSVVLVLTPLFDLPTYLPYPTLPYPTPAPATAPAHTPTPTYLIKCFLTYL